jgi:N-methylhydantoinase A
MGMGIEEAAFGIVRVANEHMAHALRVISVQRGIDPRAFTLMSFGGAGGLHVCALADALRMDKAIAPIHAGVLSALGMLVAPRGRQLSRTLNGPLHGFAEVELETELAGLAADGRWALVGEGVTDARAQCAVDLRYLGQSYTLTVPWTGRDATSAAFHEAHAQRYGHALDEPLELVNLRVEVRGPQPNLSLTRLAVRQEALPVWQSVAVAGDGRAVPVYRRADLCQGDGFDGPALVTETVATTYVASNWCCRVDAVGNLLLERRSE